MSHSGLEMLAGWRRETHKRERRMSGGKLRRAVFSIPTMTSWLPTAPTAQNKHRVSKSSSLEQHIRWWMQ